MSTPLSQLSPEALAERKVQQQEAAASLGTLEELERFYHLCQDSSWPLLLRYLAKWEDSLNKQMWEGREVSLNTVHFMKGQMWAVKVIRNLPKEIQLSIEALKAASESER